MTCRSHLFSSVSPFLFIALLLSLAAGPASSADFLVNDTADAVDAAPGNGLCATEGGVCTLRAAIQEANALAGEDTLTVPAGTFTIEIPEFNGYGPSDSAGSFYLSSAIELVGAGAGVTILDGGMIDRVIEVSFNGLATVSDLSVQNGSHSGIGVNQGSLTLQRATIQNNHGSEFGEPGGIRVDNGTLSVVESTLKDNTADFASGGILFTAGTFSAVDTVIRDNVGTGGIVAGGMICNAGTATFERVAFIGNQGHSGAGLLVWGCDATLTNATLSGNTAVSGASAGALEVFGGTLELVNVTVTANSPFGATGAMTVVNSIIAGNGGAAFKQCRTGGALVSFGNNIDEGTSCDFDHERDLPETDPLLGALNEAGGSPAHPLLTSSPAIDAVPLDDCVDFDEEPLLTDQRGVGRPQGSACDSGALEFAPEPGAIALHLAALASLAGVARARRR